MAVLQEFENKGLCRDVNHAYVCNHLPLDISPIRLFLYDLKSTLLSVCRRKDSDDDEEESFIDQMNQKMDLVNKYNMDIINIMKIDRIEQTVDAIQSKIGQSSKSRFPDKRKISVIPSSDRRISQMLFGLDQPKDKDKKESSIDSDDFGNIKN